MTQRQAFDILKMGHNVYLTGQAGSGKTHLLNEYIDFLREGKVGVGVTASTGIAATHMDGMTIHSWAGIGIRESMSPDEIQRVASKRHVQSRLKNTKVLIVDEVSMLSAAQLDLVNMICQIAKTAWKPFGGIQVVLSGDFFQLPPVQREDESPRAFVFQSRAWADLDFQICYLTDQFRQLDEDYLSVLNAIRSNSVNEETLTYLRKRYRAKVDGAVTPAKLYTHNANVDNMNEAELEKIPNERLQFDMKYTGTEALVHALKKGCLAPEVLYLKKGAVVMFIRNNFDRGYVNGTLGTVAEFDENGYPIVQTHKGQKIVATPEEWKIEENGKIRAQVTQVPLRLAWAITVHKSQGLSLDAAEIDLSRSFEPGMGYVALSRVRSLAGVRLMGLNRIALEVNKDILEVDQKFQRDSANSAKELERMPEHEKQKKQADFEKQLGVKRKPARPGKKGTKVARARAEKQRIPKEENALFEELRLLRAEIARERKVSAYIIFPNTALHDMVSVMPENMEEFAEIRGVGEKKLKDFGQEFLDVIVQYASNMAEKPAEW